MTPIYIEIVREFSTDKQSTERRIKDVYDEPPYPVSKDTKSVDRDWPSVDIHWIESLDAEATEIETCFKRILVVGCGTGEEAFQMRNRVPDAEIVAVDYSESAIKQAQASQQHNPIYKSIRFEIGDLTQLRESWRTQTITTSDDTPRGLTDISRLK